MNAIEWSRLKAEIRESEPELVKRTLTLFADYDSGFVCEVELLALDEEALRRIRPDSLSICSDGGPEWGFDELMTFFELLWQFCGGRIEPVPKIDWVGSPRQDFEALWRVFALYR